MIVTENETDIARAIARIRSEFEGTAFYERMDLICKTYESTVSRARDIRPIMIAELIRLGWIPPDEEINESIEQALAPVMATLEQAARDNADASAPLAIAGSIDDLADKISAPIPENVKRPAHEYRLLERGSKIANAWGEGFDLDAADPDSVATLDERIVIASAYAITLRDLVAVAYAPRAQRPQSCGWCILAAGDTDEAERAAERLSLEEVREEVRRHTLTCEHNPLARLAKSIDETITNGAENHSDCSILFEDIERAHRRFRKESSSVRYPRAPKES